MSGWSLRDGLLVLVMGLIAGGYGWVNVTRRRPSLWNRGWPLFYGIPALAFGALCLALAVAFFIQFASE